MNVIFGYFGAWDDAIGSAPALDAIAEQLHSPVDNQIHKHKFAESAVCVVEDGGGILGRAHDDNASLFYIGAIHGPLDRWPHPTAPLSDPDITAHFLLDQYKRVGSVLFAKVPGQFAALTIDPAKRCAQLISDPTGQRAWFVYESDTGVAFSSHLTTLALMLGAHLEIDRSHEDFFLLHGFYPHDKTPYKGVRIIAGGKTLTYEHTDKVEGQLDAVNPWKDRDLGYAPTSATEADVVESLYVAFMAALNEQLADAPKVAVLLGGVDSALVAAGLQRLGKDVETFSFFYEQAQYNQPHTDILASHLDIKHTWIPITQEVFQDGLAHFSDRFSFPTNWPNYVIQTAHLCAAIRAKGIRHCYTGDGCDTVFLGYPGTYKRAMLIRALPTLPASVTNALVWLAGWGFLDRVLGHPYRVILNVIRSLGREKYSRGFVSFRIFDEVSLKQLRVNHVQPAEDTEDILRALAEPFRDAPVLRQAYMGKALVSPNKSKMVGSSDLSGVSILSPYMHPGMKAFAMQLPEEILRPEQKTESALSGKYILLKMAEQKALLPPAVIYQPKMAAVDGPIDDWYERPLRDFMLALFEQLPFAISPGYAEALLSLTSAERLFRDRVMTDKVITHAASLLATYASFASRCQNVER